MGANLKIGATVDIASINDGMNQSVASVQEAARKIPLAFEEVQGRTKAAFNQISQDVKTAAESVSSSTLFIAESTKAYNAAVMDLRRAVTISRDAKVDDAASSAILAAAQTRVAETSEALAAAKQAEAREVVEAAEEEALSQNVVIRAFQRMAEVVTETTAEVQERLISTAEAGGLEAEGITAGFSGLSKLLGAGIAVGFASEYIDGLAKTQVELDHLSTKTGIAIEYLAGLQQILKNAGGDFETVATGLVRMEANTEKLSQGGAQGLADAFTNIGLSIEAVRGAKPEELLQMIAVGMANTADQNVRANSAIAIFGRGGQALIPVLREEGALLSADIEKQGKLTGVTEESAEAARRWTQDTAKLSAEFRSVMIPVMEHAEDVVRGIAGAFEVASALIVSTFELVSTAIVSAVKSIAATSAVVADIFQHNFGRIVADASTAAQSIISLGKPIEAIGLLLNDVFQQNYARIGTDAAEAVQSFTGIWKAGINEIGANWQEVYHTFTDQTQLPPMAKDESEPDPQPIPGKTGRNAAFERDEEQFNQLRVDMAMHGHAMDLAEEISYWQKKLADAKKGTQEYREILAKLAPLEQEQARKGGPAQPEPLETVHPDIDAVKILDEQVKATQDAAAKELEASRQSIDEQIRMAQDAFRQTQQQLAAEVRLRQITEAQKTALIAAAAGKELQVEETLIRMKEKIDGGDVKRYQQDLNENLAATRRYGEQIQQINIQAAEKVQEQWKKVWNTFNQELNNAIMSTQRDTKKASEYFAQMFNQIIQQLERWALQWLEKKAETWIQDEVTQAAAAAKQKAAQTVQAAATVGSDAAVAAAGAMAYYSSTDPIGAPALAAAQYAETISYGSASAFDKGGVVGNGMGIEGFRGYHVPILAEQGERVLTPQQTDNFHKLVNNTSSSSSSSNVTNHLHYEPKVSANTSAQMKRDLRSNADDILDIVRTGYRQGKLG